VNCASPHLEVYPEEAAQFLQFLEDRRLAKQYRSSSDAGLGLKTQMAFIAVVVTEFSNDYQMKLNDRIRHTIAFSFGSK
jgi:hypothetical protein